MEKCIIYLNFNDLSCLFRCSGSNSGKEVIKTNLGDYSAPNYNLKQKTHLCREPKLAKMIATRMNPHNLYSQNHRGMVVLVALVAPGVLQVPWDLGVLPARSALVCQSFLVHPEHPEVATKAALIPPHGAESSK